MTRLQALRSLADKVEAGEDVCARDASRIWPNGYAHAINAGCGSLDASKALHEAVLPGWTVCTMFQLRHPEDGQKPTGDWDFGLIGIFPERVLYADAQSGDPARAWLLAIIRALIAEEEAQ